MSFAKYDGNVGSCLMEAMCNVTSGFTPTVWLNMKPLQGKSPSKNGSFGIPLNFADILTLIKHIDNPQSSPALSKSSKNGNYIIQKSNNDFIVTDGNRTLMVNMTPDEFLGFRTYLFTCWSEAGIMKDICDNIAIKMANMLTVMAQRMGHTNVQLSQYDALDPRNNNYQNNNNNYQQYQPTPQQPQNFQQPSMNPFPAQPQAPQQPPQTLGGIPGMNNQPPAQNFRDTMNQMDQNPIANSNPISDSGPSGNLEDAMKNLFGK